jgi:hypothetical protein
VRASPTAVTKFPGPIERGLKGIRLIASDACLGLAESAADGTVQRFSHLDISKNAVSRRFCMDTSCHADFGTPLVNALIVPLVKALVT